MTNYSIILPIKNEAPSLPQLLHEISQIMQSVIPAKAGIHKYEIIAIDDSSKDTTLITLNSLISQIPQLKIVHFQTHQGKWAALRAGFEKAQGQILITMDSDLQDDPREIPQLLNKLAQTPSLRGSRIRPVAISTNQGYDLVSGARMTRFDPFYKVLISKLGNFLVSTITGHHFKDLNSSFKVYKREVFDEIPTEGSLLRFSLLFAHKLGYKVCEVPIHHRPRLFGQSKFGLVKYLRIIYDLILVILLFSGSGRIRKSR